jgi:8-oxo-dGTP pyrophosphatase MutT (NUDIX family)
MDPIQLAGCIILDDYDRMLLLHRSTEERVQWELPGGKIEVEQDETPAHAAFRETYEELGVQVRLKASVGKEIFQEDENVYEYHWFLAEIIAGEPTIIEQDSFDDLDYFELEDLMSIALSSNMQVLLPKILSGEVDLSV